MQEAGVEPRDGAVIAGAGLTPTLFRRLALYEVVASNPEPRSIVPKRIL